MRTWNKVLAALLFTVPAFADDAGAPKKGLILDAGLGPVTKPMADAGPVLDNPHGLDVQPGAMEAETEPETPAPSPHGKTGGSMANGMFQAPEDGSVDDRRLPIGALDVQLADPDGKPLPNTTLTLGILFSSVAKGESRKRITAQTNAQGIAHFEGLETGSAVAYRPMVITDDATFSVMPFRLSDKMGTRAILHVYPTESDIEKALVVMQSVVYAEVKDDRIQVQEALKVYNFGKTAWVPKDLLVKLPEEFTAFSTQQGMSDVGVDAVQKQGIRIHGTFVPGQQQMLEFRWQLPYKGESELHFEVGMPPHTAASRVIAPASRDMTLEVPGFPPPQAVTDEQGQRSLLTERQLRRDDPPLKSIALDIRNLPTEGPGKIIATLLAFGGVGLGLVLGTRRAGTHDRKRERERLLGDLEDLERAHQAGDVGPKTYERARREILDAIARTFAAEAPLPATARKRK